MAELNVAAALEAQRLDFFMREGRPSGLRSAILALHAEAHARCVGLARHAAEQAQLWRAVPHLHQALLARGVYEHACAAEIARQAEAAA